MLKKLDLKDNHTNRLKARQAIAKKLDEIAVENPAKLQSLAEKCRLWLAKNPDFVSIAHNYPSQKYVFVLPSVIFLFPIFLYGFLLNIFIVLIVWLLRPKFKDSGFSATIKYAFFLLLSPVNHLLFAVIFGIITSSWLLPLVIFLTGMPITVLCKIFITKCRVLKNKFLAKKYRGNISDICGEMKLIM